MKCKNGHEISPGARFCKDCGGRPHQPMHRRPWLYVLAALVVLAAGVGVGANIMINNNSAAIAKVQLQVKVDRDAAAAKARAAAAKVKADAAAAKAKAAAAAVKAQQAAALAKAGKDAADARAMAERAQAQANARPQVIVVPGPVSGAPYYDSSSASTTLNTYFDGISSGDYATAYAQLSAREQSNNGSLSEWSSGLLTSIDTNVVVNSVSNQGSGTIVANVSFHSHQAPEQGVNPGETDTNWNIDYTMVPGPGAGGYLIDNTSNASHSAG